MLRPCPSQGPLGGRALKLLFFDDYRMGVLRDGRVVDVTHALEHVGILPPQTLMERVIEAFDSYRTRFEEIVAVEAGVSLAQVRVRAPLPRPGSLLCAFSNFQDRDHTRTGPCQFFHKGSASIVGPGDTVVISNMPESKVSQPEPELAYVIGRPTKHVSEAEALDAVFGYLNLADISNRDIPRQGTMFLQKSLDTYAPMGPVIVTKDEVPDPQDLRVRLWRNGELRQDYNTSEMVTPVAAQIAWLSRFLTLMPGDVVACGTHHVGLSPINDGDQVEMEVEGMERLGFPVKSYGPRKTAHWAPPGTREA
jgi:2-keto-4-pentenoate hydratase/2-oxohepta-3-ene-1,7-dioic acid hydratase in catechol pathway